MTVMNSALTTRKQASHALRQAVAVMELFPSDSSEHADARNLYQVAFNQLIHMGMTPTQIFREAQIDLSRFKGVRS